MDEISAHIGTHFVSFKIATYEDEFISTVKTAIKSGEIIQRLGSSKPASKPQLEF